MAATTKPSSSKAATAKPSRARRAGSAAGRVYRRPRPRTGDEMPVDDADERLRARAAGAEGRKAEAASSGAFSDIDDRLTALESSSSTSSSQGAGPKKGSSSGAWWQPTRPTTFTVAGTTGPMLVELAVITVDEIAGKHRPPIPSRVLVAVGLFGLLGLAPAGPPARVATVLGWGIVIATVYASSGPNSSSPVLDTLATVGSFLSGKYGIKGATGAKSPGYAPATASKYPSLSGAQRGGGRGQFRVF